MGNMVLGSLTLWEEISYSSVCMDGGGGGRWVPFFPYPLARKRALKKGLEVLRGLLAA